jgi:hypothetical protein
VITNQNTIDWLSSHTGPVGIIYLDFAGMDKSPDYFVDETIQYRRHEAGGCRDQTELKVVAGSPSSGVGCQRRLMRRRRSFNSPAFPIIQNFLPC